jgi:hypothetical protein
MLILIDDGKGISWEKTETFFSKLRIDMDAEWCTFALQWALFLELGVIEMGKSDGA